MDVPFVISTARDRVMTQRYCQALINQVNLSLDAYLRTVMKLSDSLYYGVIKNVDLLRKGDIKIVSRMLIR